MLGNNANPYPSSSSLTTGVAGTPFATMTQGDWSIVNSPSTNFPENYLLGVSCPSASDCWAVGYSKVGIAAQTLIEHWNGTTWAIVTSPNVLTAQNFLYGVTCVSSSDCWAVGFSINGTVTSTFQTLVARWDGSAWAIVTSPNTTTTRDNLLYSVTCASASNCWTAGYASNDSYYAQTLMERWDGNFWTIVTSPNVSPTQANLLFGVTCVSASNCWSVGYIYTNAGATFQTLIERWDGASWTIVPSSNTSAAETNTLLGVTCGSASDCWAIGYYVNANSSYQTLIERWNGNSWIIVTSPNTSAAETNALHGVTCAAATDCWAVGYYINGNGNYQTLIERWDGNAWTIVASPNTGTGQFNLVDAVTCVSTFDCWAVGYYANGTGYQTLTEKYTALPPPIPTGAVSRKTHGTAGDFDIDLPLAGNPGIECRSGGANGDHDIVVCFDRPVTIGSVTSSCGALTGPPVFSGNCATIHLTGVSNASRCAVTLNNISDGSGGTGNLSIPINFLLGDTNADTFVNSGDIAQTKSRSGQLVGSTNFRSDVTVDGNLNSADIGLVKSKSGTAIP